MNKDIAENKTSSTMLSIAATFLVVKQRSNQGIMLCRTGIGRYNAKARI
jgi:ribose 5-phosphate isomerase RpiB